MPEVSAAELKRLKLLDERIVRVTGDRDELREVRKQLKAEITALKRRVKELERDLKKATAEAGEDKRVLEQRVSALIDENREQAKILKRTQSDAERVTGAAEKLRASNDALKAQLQDLLRTQKEAVGKVKKFERSNVKLSEQLVAARRQLEESGKPVMLQPSETAEIIDRFIGEFGVGPTGLVVRDTEIDLQVAFLATEGKPGFVVPTVGMSAGELPPLHSIRLKLGRTPDVGGSPT